MKKTLLVIAAISVALPVLAKMPSIDVGGKIKVRGEEINNTDFLNTTAKGTNDDKDSHVKHEVMIWLDSELSDGVGAHICLQKADEEYWWAEREASSLNNLQNNITLHHANITIDDVAGLVDLTLGRQEIGKKDNELVMCYDAIDAKKAEANFGNLSLTGICGKISETSFASNTDTNIQGIIGSIKLDVLSGVNLTGYWLGSKTNKSITGNADKNNVIGGKVSGSMDIASTLNYSVEYAIQKGSDTTLGKDRNANAYRVVLGYTTDVEGLGALAIEGSYLKMGTKGTYYTGINPDIDYYAALVDQTANTGGDVLREGSGRKDLNVNAKITPEAIDNITLGISWTNFSSVDKVNGKTGLGSELDLSANYKYSDATSFGVTYARFTPGDIYNPATDAATMLRCELLTKF